MQHKDICEFPSQEFYEDRLKTAVEQPRSILRVDSRSMPVVFGHIEGKAISLIANTAKGNENSKANMAERDKVVLYYKTLCYCVDSTWKTTMSFRTFNLKKNYGRAFFFFFRAWFCYQPSVKLSLQKV